MVAPGQRRRRAGGPEELQAGAGGRAQPQVGGAPGGLDERDHVATDGLGDVQLPHGGHEVPHLGRVGDRLQGGERVGGRRSSSIASSATRSG